MPEGAVMGDRLVQDGRNDTSITGRRTGDGKVDWKRRGGDSITKRINDDLESVQKFQRAGNDLRWRKKESVASGVSHFKCKGQIGVVDSLDIVHATTAGNVYTVTEYHVSTGMFKKFILREK